MPNRVQLGDVHTYYEEDGAGEPLVLLHPGLADSRAFEEYVPELARHFHVFRPDRRGHGRTPDVDGPITYEVMARETIAFLERVVGGPAYLLGHSDGCIARSRRSPSPTSPAIPDRRSSWWATATRRSPWSTPSPFAKVSRRAAGRTARHRPRRTRHQDRDRVPDEDVIDRIEP